MQSKISKIVISILIASGSIMLPSSASGSSPNIVFPVAPESVDDVRWTDTWGAPRSGGRSHIGVDIMGDKMTPLVAVESGEISWSDFDNQGNYLRIIGDSGWAYMYIHMNNDTPGTDDASASCTQVFSPKLCQNLDGDKIKRGVRVEKGEFIGFMGDSGNAEWTAPHLHFEMHYPTGNGNVTPTNPYPLVNKALNEIAEPTINSDVSSTTSSEAQILRLYRAYFGRIPDQDGFDYWLDKREEGVSLEDVSGSFALSSEFYTRYSKLSDSQYIDQLYVKVLNRLPDEKGKKYWIDQFNSNKITRSSIVVYFSEGEEMKTRLNPYTEGNIAKMLYSGRLMNVSEIRTWVELRKTKELDELVDLILG